MSMTATADTLTAFGYAINRTSLTGCFPDQTSWFDCREESIADFISALKEHLGRGEVMMIHASPWATCLLFRDGIFSQQDVAEMWQMYPNISSLPNVAVVDDHGHTRTVAILCDSREPELRLVSNATSRTVFRQNVRHA